MIYRTPPVCIGTVPALNRPSHFFYSLGKKIRIPYLYVLGMTSRTLPICNDGLAAQRSRIIRIGLGFGKSIVVGVKGEVLSVTRESVNHHIVST